MGVSAVLMVACAVSSAALGTAETSAYSGSAVAAGANGVRAQEWWLAGLGVPRAWQQGKGSGVTVAVLSTGVSSRAPDLAGDVITGPDYSGSGRTPDGAYWGACGTAVASVIAGHGHGAGDGTGMVGIAPDARILSLRVTLEYDDPLNASSAITRRLPDAIANGILYAVSHGAKVIDLPLDPATFGLAGDAAAAGGSAAERSAVAYALSKGVLLVAAAGDDGESTSRANYPAAYPGVLAVGAVGRDGRVGSFSSRSPYVALTAPGVGLMAASMVPTGVSGYAPGYSRISTTSVASGMVAGVAALIMSKYPQLPAAQVTSALRGSVSGRASVVSAATAMKTAATLAASVKPVAPAAPATPKKTVPSAAPVPTHGPAAPRAASAVASSVLRDAVYALGAMIVLLFGVMLVTRARRRRAEAQVDAAVTGGGVTGSSVTGRSVTGSSVTGSGALALAAGSRPRAGGQHEQRRRGRAREAADEPVGEDTLTGLRHVARPDSAAVSGWPDPSGWQGRGLGEIAHSSLSQAAFGQQGPAIQPLPKAASRASRGMASPPWSPAPQPDDAASPLALGGPSPFPAEADNGLRVPGDVPAPHGEAGPPFGDAPAPFGDPPMPHGDAPVPHGDAPMPHGDAPASLGDPPVPFADAPVPYVDIPAPFGDSPVPFGDAPAQYSDPPAPFGDPPASLGGLTGPFAGRDVLTQASFGFAAAPVPTDYPASEPASPPELTHWNPGDSTDPFPALPDPGDGQPDDDTA